MRLQSGHVRGQRRLSSGRSNLQATSSEGTLNVPFAGIEYAKSTEACGGSMRWNAVEEQSNATAVVPSNTDDNNVSRRMVDSIQSQVDLQVSCGRYCRYISLPIFPPSQRHTTVDHIQYTSTALRPVPRRKSHCPILVMRCGEHLWRCPAVVTRWRYT